MARCAYHRGREAVGACVNCGRMVCLECQTMLGGKVYCQPCAEEIFVKKTPEADKSAAKAAAKATAKPAAKPAAGDVSGAWWLLPIFLTWVGGIIAWALTKDKDPRKAKSMLRWGIGLFFLYLALWVGMIILYAFAIGGSVSMQMP